MKKGTIILIAASVATFILLGVFVVLSEMNSYSQFAADGYLIDPASTDAQEITDVGVINFSSGGKYRERYASNVEFSDADGKSQKVALDRFLHYNDNSLGALTKGVIVDLDKITEENFGYYSVTRNTVLVNQNNSYALSVKGDTVNIDEFVWKISDNQYMLCSPQVKLKIGDANIIFDNYAEITYVDSGIVRISNIDGVYETISENSNLTTDSGKILSLIGKGFFDDDGNELLALDELAIDDSSYTEADETDSPSLTIPTFIAQDGENGESGTDGEEGDSGADGDQGTEGSEGTSGENGLDGSDGATGNTGIIGQDGKAGVGANAETEVAAADLNAKPTMGLATTTTTDDEGNATSAETDYSVASTSATMTIQANGDTSTVDKDTLTVTLYDKDTWSVIDTVSGEAAKALINGTTNKLTLTYDNLTPDKDYVVVVSGEYEVVDGSGEYVPTTFFTKQFKTTELGISLDKYMVDEDYVSVNTTLTDSSIVSYKVVFYQLDSSDDSTRVWATYTIATNTTDFPATSGDYAITGSTENDQWTCYLGGTNEANEGGVSIVRADDYKSTTVATNTTYYAKITDVIVKVGNNTNTADSSDLIVKLQTLKKAPSGCDSWTQDDAGEDVLTNQIAISDITPTLSSNTLTHSLTLELPQTIYDKDKGVVSYTYQLYTYDNATTQTLKYEKTYTTKQPANFVIDDNDTSIYVGKVVVNFDNNESVVNYSTLFSATSYLPALSSNFSIDIQYDTPNSDSTCSLYSDAITGTVIIHDTGAQVAYDSAQIKDNPKLSACTVTGGSFMQYVKNNSIPVIIQFAGHNKTYNQSFKAEDIVYDVANSYFTIKFSQDGLFHSYYSKDANNKATLMTTYYSIRVYGPYDVDESGTISTQENQTFIDSISVGMAVDNPLQVVGLNNLASADADFELLLGFTTPESTSATDDVTVATLKSRAAANANTATSTVEDQMDVNYSTAAGQLGFKAIDETKDESGNYTDTANYNNENFYAYEVSRINTVTVSLTGIDEYGQETKLGLQTINMDGETDEEGYHNASIFKESFYSRSNVQYIDDDSTDGLELKDASGASNDQRLILTPESFNATSAMNRYDSQSWFVITVESITDYADNEIPVDPNHNSYKFKIREKHKVEDSLGDSVINLATITRNAAEQNSEYVEAASKDLDMYESFENIDIEDSKTSVGMEFYSKYDYLPYQDYEYDGTNTKIIYTVYEISEKFTIDGAQIDADGIDGNGDDEYAMNFYDTDYYADLQASLGCSDADFEKMFADYDSISGISESYQAIKAQTGYITKKAVIEAASFDPIQLYYDGTKAYSCGTGNVYTPLEVYSADGKTLLSDADSGTKDVISRGKRYFVTYVIETETSTRICNSSRITNINADLGDGTVTQNALLDTVKDIYPYCAYNNYGYLDKESKQFKAFKTSEGKAKYYDNLNGQIAAVPLLRSYVKEDEKLAPVVSRYLNTTDTSNYRYMYYTYFIFDPDNAIPVDAEYEYGAGDGCTYALIKEYNANEQAVDNRTFYEKIKIPDYNNSYTCSNFAKETISTDTTSHDYYTFAVVNGQIKYSDTKGTALAANKYYLNDYYSYGVTLFVAKTDYAASLGEWVEQDNDWATSKDYREQTDIYNLNTTYKSYVQSYNATYPNRVTAYAAGTFVTGSDTPASEAVTNEGNYQLAIQLRGTALDYFTAYRVVISDNSTNPYSGKYVIYDPVYVNQEKSGSKINGTDQLSYNKDETAEIITVDMGQLYGTFIDEDTLKVKDGIENVYVYVTGYYNTGISGYGNFTPTTDGDVGTGGTAWSALRSYNTLPENKSLDSSLTWSSTSADTKDLENIYIERMGTMGAADYYDNPEKIEQIFKLTDYSKFSSLVIPGSASGDKTGLNIKWNTYKASGITVTYNSIFYRDSIVRSTNANTYLVSNAGVADSQFINGPDDYNSNHSVPQKVAPLNFKFKLNTKTDGTNFDIADSYALKLTDALPAVAQNDDGLVQGQKTYTHTVTVSGKKNTGEPYIYAMLLDKDTGKYVQITKKDGKFAVVRTNEIANESTDYNDYYSYDDFGTSYIDQSDANSAKVTFSNLVKSHNYQIKYFTYINKQITFLWNTDTANDCDVSPFNISTKENVKLGVGDDPIHYEYLTYANKYAQIYYGVSTAMDGYDDTSRIYWALFDDSQIDSAKTSSKTDGTYDYDTGGALITSYGTPLATGYTQKKVSESGTEYYSDGIGAGFNTPITLTMTPGGDGASNLQVGKQYCLRIYVGENKLVDGKYTGSIPDVSENGGYIDIVFTVPIEKDGVKHETKYLDDPTATVNATQKRVTVDGDAKIILYTDATTIDDMNAMMDDSYYLAVFDERNTVVAYKKITRSVDPSLTSKIKDGAQYQGTFQWMAGNNDDASNTTPLYLTAGDEYKIRVLSHIDLNNDKTADTFATYLGTKHKRESEFIEASAIESGDSNKDFCILAEKNITAKKAVSANLECTASTTSSLTLRFSQTQNMADVVDSILITVNDNDGNDVFSKEVTVTSTDQYTFIPSGYTLGDGYTYFTTDDPEIFSITFSGSDWTTAMKDTLGSESGTFNFTASFMLLQGGSSVGSDLNTCSFSIKSDGVIQVTNSAPAIENNGSKSTEQITGNQSTGNQSTGDAKKEEPTEVATDEED